MAKTSVHGSMVADDTLDLDAIVSGDKSGADDAIITGTIPADGRAVAANSDGDLVDAGFAASAIYRSGGTDVAIADGGTGASNAAAAFTALKQAASRTATGVVEEATEAEVRAATDAKFIDAGHLSSAAALVALTDAATVAVDWTAAFNFSLTITTDRILGNPTNEIPGTFRTVYVVSDGGPDTLTFGSEYGGVPPTLDDITTTKAYLVTIYCRAAGQFLVTAIDGSPV